MTKPSSLLWIIALWSLALACREKTKPTEQVSPSVVTQTESSNGASYSVLHLASVDSGYYIKVCDTQQKCFGDLSTSQNYTLQGLKPGHYDIEIFHCTLQTPQFDCSESFAKTQIDQPAYADKNIESYQEKSLALDVQEKIISYQIFGQLSSLHDGVAKCIGSTALASSDPRQQYFDHLNVFLTQNPVVAIQGLADAFAQNSLNTNFMQAFQNQVGFGLYEYTPAKNVRARLVNKVPTQASTLQAFEGASKHVAESGSSHLILERLSNPTETDPTKHQWELYRTITWPEGAEAPDHTKLQEGEFVELPPLSENDLIRFEGWYAKQGFVAGPSEGELLRIYTDKNQYLQTLRSTLLLPPNVDLEKLGFNFEEPWKLKEPNLIFKDYYGFDPAKDSAKWEAFLEAHREEFWQFANTSYVKWPFLKKFRDNFNPYLVNFAKWDNFSKYLLDGNFKAYNEQALKLRAFPTKTAACNCGAGEALNMLYRTEHFDPTLDIAPGKLQRQAEKMGASEVHGSGIVGAGASLLAIGAVTGAAVEIASQIQLAASSSDENLTSCFKTARQTYITNADPMFRNLQALAFQKHMLNYFYQKNLNP